MSLNKAKSTGLLSPEESKYLKPSYRQKGSEIKGSLYRGSTANAFTKKTIGSIPSKFETVLYPQNNITKKGFGSNGFRFTAQVSENPGPGSYIDPINRVNSSMRLTSDSFSRKGYGNGFISTSDRFRIENYQPYQIPGPGAYKAPQLVPVTGKRSIGSAFEPGTVSEKYKAKVSSVFTEPKGKRRVEKPPNLLGPGSYGIIKTEPEKEEENKITAAFKFSGQRFFLGKSAAHLPGPGQYETDMEGLKRGLSQAALGHLAEPASANFKQPAGAKRVKVNLYDPFENVEGEEKRTPGPGQYQEDQYALAKRLQEKTNGTISSMFAQPSIVDRFGKPNIAVKSTLEKLSPGPGQYYKHEIPKPKSGEAGLKVKNGAASAFKSEVKRGAYLMNKPGPGPAFYKLRQEPIKDSKNINPTKEWI